MTANDGKTLKPILKETYANKSFNKKDSKYKNKLRKKLLKQLAGLTKEGK